MGSSNPTWLGILVLIFVTAGSSVSGAESLFPRPFHVRRSVHDPVKGSGDDSVQEYYEGNVVVVVESNRVTMTDYARREITEIDHARKTYSVTPFSAWAEAERKTVQPRRYVIQATSRGRVADWRGATNADSYEVSFSDAPNGPSDMRVKLHPAVQLSREALEVLIGAAFPHQRTIVHQALLTVSGDWTRKNRPRFGSSSRAPDTYPVPFHYAMTFAYEDMIMSGSVDLAEFDSAVVRPDQVAIPKEYELVESPILKAAREVRDWEVIGDVP